jgi:isopentenyldiphosphate isomerase
MPQITIPAIADDGSLYPIEKLRAHELGVLHLAISIFVFNPKGELLIQSARKKSTIAAVFGRTPAAAILIGRRTWPPARIAACARNLGFPCLCTPLAR